MGFVPENHKHGHQMSSELWAALVGGLIGVAGSLIPWVITTRNEARRDLATRCERLIALSYETGGYMRDLVHAKADVRDGNIGAYNNLGRDPLAQIVAMTSLGGFDNTAVTVQEMADTMQEFFGQPASELNPEIAQEFLGKMNGLIRMFARMVLEAASKGGVAHGPDIQMKSRLSKPGEKA
jgi:nucleoside-diphosphate-sugar epimerase